MFVSEDSQKTDNKYTLYTYAFCGNIDSMIEYLSNIVEKEIWSFTEGGIDILRTYIFKTFEQCNKQNKIIISDDGEWSCANTGLLTPSGKDILIVFCKNDTSKSREQWFLKGFYDKTDRRFMDHFANVPSLATYTDNFEDFYFNPDLNIEISTDHILDDHWERINSQLKMPKDMVNALLAGVIEQAKIKVKRNVRLVVPQFYKGRIMYLLPIYFPTIDDKTVTMALAIEKTNSNQYRANTIFTKEDAYEKARLLMKPEANWLIE